MEKYFFLFFFISFNYTIQSQEELVDYQHEIFCGSENYNYQLTYNLEQIGTVWDVYWPNSTTHIFTIDTDGSSDGGLFVAEPNLSTSYWQGYNYIATPERVPAEDFGFGLYKLSVLNKYIYLDWRDTRYGSYVYCNGGNCADIYIKYDGFDGNIYIKNHASFDWGNAIPNGTYLSIWELKNQGVPLTSDAPNYWTNCLVVIPSQTGNNPRLVWGPYPSSSITVQAYKIYRKVGSGNFSLIHTNNESQFEYTDTDYYIPTSGGSQLQYYINALFVTEELSQPTNTVTTNGIITLKEISGANTFVYKNILNTNYPNPFNPTTKISYSIKEEGLVMLKVYDILGKEIATLVNENKPAGNFEAEFDASSLPSGMYIYKLQAGSFVQTRKMLLMK